MERGKNRGINRPDWSTETEHYDNDDVMAFVINNMIITGD